MLSTEELDEIYATENQERVEKPQDGFDDVLKAALDANAVVIRYVRHRRYREAEPS